MGYTAPVILKVNTPEYGVLEAELSDGKIYRSDLRSFKKVYCYPQDLQSWEKVSVGEHGINAVWACRFEVHADQIIATALEVRNSEQTA